MNRLLPSDPHLFRPIQRALLAGLVVLFSLAALLPAPLEIPADPAHAPNPARSAWFLLWIQELVSYDTLAIHSALALAVLLVALPWLRVPPVQHAAWFPPAHRAVAVVAILVALAVVALTAVALFFRGANWCLACPG